MTGVHDGSLLPLEALMLLSCGGMNGPRHPPKIHGHLGLQNVTLRGIKVFADVAKISR